MRHAFILYLTEAQEQPQVEPEERLTEFSHLMSQVQRFWPLKRLQV